MPEQADQLRPSNSAVFAQEVIFYIALRAGNHDEVRRLIALNRELLDAPQDWSADLVYQGVLPFANKATPLITAIELNDLPMAELLLDAGADVNGICGCVTAEAPLWSAALFNRYNHARLLLEHGADPNVVSAAGNRPLHLAAMRGFTDIAELLLQHGANSELKDDINPGVRWFPTDNRAEVLPRTPAQWATEKEQRQRQHNRNRAADVIETGIKAIDLFAPIEHGAVIRVPFMAGVGMMVLLGELSRRFHDMDNGVAIWTGFTQPPFDLLDFEADVAELGLQKTILISLASFKERHEVRRSAFERGLVAAEALRDSGKRVLTIVLSAQGFESDIEAYLPRLKGTVTTIVVSPFADTSEVWDSLPPPYTAQITLDRERAKAHLFPAISPTGTLSNTLVSARHTRIASSARSALGKLSQAPQPLLAYLAQPFFTAEPFTGRPGEWVAVDDLLSDVEQLVEAEDV